MRDVRRLLDVLALSTCIAVITDAGMLSRPQAAAPLKFEVSSIKSSPANGQSSGSCRGAGGAGTTIPQGHCVFHHANLRLLISRAYPIASALRLEDQIIGGPDWTDGNFFDIDTKAEDTSSTTTAQLQQMLQTLLKESFKLTFHRETKILSGYNMVPAKGGFKLKAASGDLTSADYRAATRNFIVPPFFANNMSLTHFADLLSTMLKTPVVDKTGIPGKYHYFLNSAETGDESAGSIFAALQDQLGLKLEAAKLPFDIYVIDHAEKPPEE